MSLCYVNRMIGLLTAVSGGGYGSVVSSWVSCRTIDLAIVAAGALDDGGLLGCTCCEPGSTLLGDSWTVSVVSRGDDMRGWMRLWAP